MEVELPIGLGGFTAYQPLTNSECHDIAPAVRAVGAKVHVPRGKQPRPSAKVPKCMLS